MLLADLTFAEAYGKRARKPVNTVVVFSNA